MREFISFGVIFAKGARCYMKGFTGVSGLEKITDEELEEIMNDFDPIEAPPGPYKVQPNVIGEKFISLTYFYKRIPYNHKHWHERRYCSWSLFRRST